MSAAMDRRGQRWTREELKELERLRGEGKTYAEIAAALGRCYGGVENALKAHGMQLRPYAQWTRDQIQALIRMKRAGKKCREIAEATGHTLHSVHSKIADVRKRAAEMGHSL